jgi:uncharacterized membrane protein
MTRAKAAVWLFAAVSVLSFIAALIPVLKGEQVNATFLGTGVIWLVIAVASAKKARGSSKGPPAA